MNKTTLTFTLALVAGLASISAAHATLIDRGGGMIDDDDLDITWLSDANYAQTSSYDADGRMTWDDANAWAANLSYGGYSDWRLPSALNQDLSGPCFGYFCTGSEMGHLFYIEGGLSTSSSILASTILDDYFTNMQSLVYWSGTEYATLGAWVFDARSGHQNANYSTLNEFYAWAVRPGDVAAVPEPATLLLLGLGLAGLAGLGWARATTSGRRWARNALTRWLLGFVMRDFSSFRRFQPNPGAGIAYLDEPVKGKAKRTRPATIPAKER